MCFIFRNLFNESPNSLQNVPPWYQPSLAISQSPKIYLPESFLKYIWAGAWLGVVWSDVGRVGKWDEVPWLALIDSAEGSVCVLCDCDFLLWTSLAPFLRGL